MLSSRTLAATNWSLFDADDSDELVVDVVWGSVTIWSRLAMCLLDSNCRQNSSISRSLLDPIGVDCDSSGLTGSMHSGKPFRCSLLALIDRYLLLYFNLNELIIYLMSSQPIWSDRWHWRTSLMSTGYTVWSKSVLRITPSFESRLCSINARRGRTWRSCEWIARRMYV